MMRLVKRNINRDGSGFVVLYPEEPEDMVGRILAPDLTDMCLHDIVARIQSDPTGRSTDSFCYQTSSQRDIHKFIITESPHQSHYQGKITRL